MNSILRILNIMSLWVLFKSMEKVDVFVLAGNLLSWVWAASSDQISVDFAFSVRSIFQSLCNAVYIYPAQWPVWDLGSGLSWSSVFRIFAMHFWVRSNMDTSVVSPEIYKQQVLGPGHFAKLLFLCCIPGTFWFFETSLLVLWPENWPLLLQSFVHFP